MFRSLRPRDAVCRVAAWLCATLLASACEAPAPAQTLRYEAAGPVMRPLVLAVHPLHNPRQLFEAYGPLAAQVGAAAGEPLRLEASRDYAAFEAKIRRREPEVILPNPWQALLAMRHGYRVIAMAGDADDFRGLFLVRRDGPVQAPGDLRGRAVAYPSPTAVAAAMLPQWFLHQHGLDTGRDVASVYVGSQESSILHVWSGQVPAAATWPPPWRAFQQRHPAQAAELRVIWQTEALPNNAVMVRNDLEPARVERLRAALLGLHDSESGRATLAGAQTSRFWPADDTTYDAVRRFVQRFERELRPAERQLAGGTP